MNTSENDLISRCLGGDGAAFHALHAAHVGRIKAYFLRSGFAPADADDLTQEVFVRAFKSLRTFDPVRGTFVQWSAVIARNVARKRYARRPEPEHFDPELAEEMFAAADNPAESPEAREEMDKLAECIGDLPPDLARVVRLRYVEARTTRGIAAATGIPEATVRLRLKEALGRLERGLKQRGVLE